MKNEIIRLVILIFVIGVAANMLQTFLPALGEYFRFSPNATSTAPLPPPAPHASSTAPSPEASSVSTTSPPIAAVGPSEVPLGLTANDLSPFFRKIRIGSVSPGAPGGRGEIRLSTAFQDETRITITGWLLRGNWGNHYLPQAVESYDPSGIAPAKDIVLEKNQSVAAFLAAPPNPIGNNIRLNKCMGYLDTTLRFNPPLPRNCPASKREEVKTFTGQCQDYIFSLPACTEPVSNPPVPQHDDACRAYLKKLNYKGCFERYRGDTDFLGNEWRIWLGGNFLDPRHDRILLQDSAGLVVDVYEY